MALRDQRGQELPRLDPLNLQAWTKLCDIGYEGCHRSLANHAKRSEETSLYMGLYPRENIQQDAEWSTAGMDNLRLLQNARGKRPNVQIAGFDASPPQRRRLGTI